MPENPLVRLQKQDRGRRYVDDSGNLIPRPAAARARMRTARVVALRRHFDRTHLKSA